MSPSLFLLSSISEKRFLERQGGLHRRQIRDRGFAEVGDLDWDIAPIPAFPKHQNVNGWSGSVGYAVYKNTEKGRSLPLGRVLHFQGRTNDHDGIWFLHPAIQRRRNDREIIRGRKARSSANTQGIPAGRAIPEGGPGSTCPASDGKPPLTSTREFFTMKIRV